MRFKHYCKSGFESVDLSVFLDRFFSNPTHEFKDQLSVQMRTFTLQDLYLIQFDRNVSVLQNILFFSKQIMTWSEKILAVIFKGLFRLRLSDLSDSEDSVTPEWLWKTLLQVGMRVSVHLTRIIIQTGTTEWTQDRGPARHLTGATRHMGDWTGRGTAGQEQSSTTSSGDTPVVDTSWPGHQTEGLLPLRSSLVAFCWGSPPSQSNMVSCLIGDLTPRDLGIPHIQHSHLSTEGIASWGHALQQPP